MASTKALDIRWIRRYRCFCVAGCVILIIQVFLAYIFLNINSENEKNSQELLSGRGKLNFEVLDDRVSVESSRRFRDRDNYVLLDDEEGGEESNAVFHRVKMPPDKAALGDKHPTKAKPGGGGSAVNRTISVVPTLRLEELDFVPWCDVRGKEPVSAIHRAKTQHCKQLLANVTCLSQADMLYPHRLPHSCPNQGLEPGKSLGCFQDEKRLRLLSGYYANLSRSNSPQQCIDLCLQSGFPYAGVQFVSECFCGVEEPPSTARLPDSSCNMKCPADPKEACGGYYTINVYQTGIAKLVPQPPAEARPLADAQSGVRILYLLTLNGRAVRQVRRLIRALYHPDHFFYVHVDARQDYMFRELLVLEQLSNVKLARERHATIWGGASLLTMLLESMRLLVHSYSHWKWDFIINLSESDFPIKTNKQLVEFLSANRERNFVKSHGREVQRFVQKQGLDKTFVECEAHMWRAGFRQLPWGIALDGGSDWVALSRPFVTFLADWHRDPLLTGLVSVFKYTLLPAESFFHTALRNSALCASYTDNNLHVTNWKRRLGCKCQYKHVVDWCGCSPNDFKMDGWPRIQATEGRPLFFARKFEPIISQAAILQLEEWLYGTYPRNVTNVASYWQSVWHEGDISPGFDDTLGTVAHSLARLATRSMANLDQHCATTVAKLIEVTTYMDNDYYKGSLVRYEVQSKNQGKRKGQTLQLETWLRPDEHFALLSTVGPAFRIKLMAVSSDLDQKEQTHRNVLRALSVFTEVSAAVHVGAGVSGGGGGGAFNATLLWLDPLHSLADISTIYIEDEAPSLQFVKPVLKRPLLPGVWQLRLAWNGTVIAHTDFLICPLQFTSGAPLLQHQTTFVHSGPGQPYRAVQSAAGVGVGVVGGVGGGSEPDQSALQRRAKLNAKRFGKDLLQWIDSLTSRFYRVVESCVASSNEEVQLCRPLTLEPCQATVWSSLSPDPKSHLAIDRLKPLPQTLRTF